MLEFEGLADDCPSRSHCFFPVVSVMMTVASKDLGSVLFQLPQST